MWASLEGTMRRSSPTRAFPVARIRFSPLAVRGNVSCAGVSAIEGPFCFAVTDYEGSWGGHCWGWWGVNGGVRRNCGMIQ